MPPTDPRSTALLVMDVQQGIVARFGSPTLLPAVAMALATARGAGIRVIFVRVAFRPGFPEVSPRNRSFAAIREHGAFTESDPATQVDPAVAPLADEAVVLKRRVSAFSGSDLEVLLRAGGTTRLVLSGIATSGVVLSTLRQAADLDYELTVLSDACADTDPEVHRVLLEKVFPRQAEVMTVAEWAKGIGRKG